MFERFAKKEEEEMANPENEWVELDNSAFKEGTSIGVCVESLKSFSDTNRIQDLLREGKIVFLKIRDLRQRDLTELKRAVEKMKKTCLAMEGDIAGIDEDFLVLTPSFARIWRGQ